MSYTASVDIGGTATDTVLLDDRGALTVGKAFSTPPTYIEGIIGSVTVAAESISKDLQSLLANTQFFFHSTTVAENAIATNMLPKAGLLVTAGSEDVLLLARTTYARWVGAEVDEIKNPVYLDKPSPLIPTSLIRGIRERSDVRGNTLLEVDERQAEEAVRELVESGAEAIGVVFLHSYVSPENERVVANTIERLYPSLPYTLSSGLGAAIGEYERASSVALNVRLRPLCSRYLENLASSLANNGLKGEPHIMQAYGGLLDIKDAAKYPTGLIESGPVGGLMGSKFLADGMGYQNVIAADMGGTTFKAGAIREGALAYQLRPLVLRYPYSVPKMDVASIPMAGGSVISLDPRTLTPRVGPESAGASPGPVCYKRGGKEPTLTDVDLILGYLNPSFFLGGRATLDRDAALEAFEQQIADPLGLGVLEAAGQVYKLANNIMRDLLHKMTVQRGLDPRGYLLLAYGGTAGMHFGSVGEALHASGVAIPEFASVQGAFGVNTSDFVREYQKSMPLLAVAANTDAAGDTLRTLIEAARTDLKADGFGDQGSLVECFVDMCYRGQKKQLTVPIEVDAALSDEGSPRIDLDQASHQFERLYESLYGEAALIPGVPAMCTTFRARATGLLRKPTLRVYDEVGPEPSTSALAETREIYFDHNGVAGLTTTSCYDFDELKTGNRIEGPAVIWTPTTTAVIQPGQKAEIDQHKTIRISWDSAIV